MRVTVAPGAHVALGAGSTVGRGHAHRRRGGHASHVGAGHRPRRALRDRRARPRDVGAQARLGDEVVLIDFDHGTADVELPVRLQGLPTAPIAIGERARIDYGAAILRGVTVGAGAHVGPRSVVVRDVAPDAEVQGVPAHAPKGPRRQPQAPARPA